MATKEAIDAINEMNSSLDTFVESLTADISFVDDETSRCTTDSNSSSK